MSSNDVALHPLTSTGGVSSEPAHPRDPFEALDDLMQVVEALCPAWPNRDVFPDSAAFIL
jgi:hypothetical protein